MRVKGTRSCLREVAGPIGIGFVIGAVLAVLILVGCGSSSEPEQADSSTAQPDAQATIDAALAATVTAQRGEAAPPSEPKDSPEKRSNTGELILNWPWELNLTAADLPEGWVGFAELFPTRTLHGYESHPLFRPPWFSACATRNEEGCVSGGLSVLVAVFENKNLLESIRDITERDARRSLSKEGVTLIRGPDMGDESESFNKGNLNGIMFVKGNVFVLLMLETSDLDRASATAEVKRLARIVKNRIESSKHYIPSQ